MSDQTSDKPLIFASLTGHRGSTASDNGDTIKLGVVVNGNQPLNLLVPTDRAIDLVMLISTAVGQARRNHSGNANERYVYPVERWEIAPQMDDQLLTLTLRMSGDIEVCFQINKSDAHHFFEALSAVLGVGQISTIPKSQTH